LHLLLKGKKSPSKKKAASAGGKISADEKILAAFYEKLEWDITEVPEEDILTLSGYAGADSRGYRDGKKLLLAEGKIEKTEAKIYKLTKLGLQGKPATTEPKFKTNDEYQEEFILKRLTPKIGAPEEKFRAFLGVMKDGSAHSHDELLAATGYKKTDSKGYRNIMKGLKDFKCLEPAGGRGMFQLTDKAFRFGRP